MYEEDNPIDENQLVEKLVEDHIREGFKKFGIEGTEDVIREAYGNNPKALAIYLRVYNNILENYKSKGGEKR